MTDPSKNIYAYLGLFAGLLSIGFSGIFVRWAEAPGTITAFYRMGIAAVVVTIPFIWQARDRERNLTRPGLAFAILGGLLFALDLTFWTTGIDLSGASKPTLMANTAPLWVGIGSFLIFKERMTATFWVGLIVAMLGAAVVLGVDLLHATEVGLGTFLGLLAAVFYGAYYLVTQRGRSSLNTISYFWITAASASVFLFLINIFLGRSFVGYDRFTIYNFLAIGLIVQVIGWSLINYAQGYLPASIVAPTLLGQPIVTAIIAVILLGETFTMWQIVGGFIVMSGVYIVHRSRSNKSRVEHNSSPLEEKV